MTVCRRRAGLFRVSLEDFGHCPLQAKGCSGITLRNIKQILVNQDLVRKWITVQRELVGLHGPGISGFG